MNLEENSIFFVCVWEERKMICVGKSLEKTNCELSYLTTHLIMWIISIKTLDGMWYRLLHTGGAKQLHFGSLGRLFGKRTLRTQKFNSVVVRTGYLLGWGEKKRLMLVFMIKKRMQRYHHGLLVLGSHTFSVKEPDTVRWHQRFIIPSRVLSHLRTLRVFSFSCRPEWPSFTDPDDLVGWLTADETLKRLHFTGG